MADDEIVELQRTVQGMETKVAAQIVTLLAPAGGSFNVSEAEAKLRRETEAMTAQRRHQGSIAEMRDERALDTPRTIVPAPVVA
ncbi:histidine ammonia-lyase [Methylobacterium sp. RAS18]|nr:histidine ammonia-lyase [Methylobacterium sp. RAS18]